MRNKLLYTIPVILALIAVLLPAASPVSADTGGDTDMLARYTYGDPPEYIDNQWEMSPAPYNHQMIHDDYTMRIKEDFTAGQDITGLRKGFSEFLEIGI